MTTKKSYEDQGYFRRKYPRRSLKRSVGVIAKGTYFICQSDEIGEGGMSLDTDMVLLQGTEVVVSLQIPNGDFISVRGEVKSSRKRNGTMIHGLAFAQIPFANKRQIRAFVSARTMTSELLGS